MAIDDSELAAKKARRQAAMQIAGLTVLLERAGGSASFTEAEYDEIRERYGGRAKLTIHMEVVRSAGQPDEVRLTLTSKTPENAELVS